MTQKRTTQRSSGKKPLSTSSYYGSVRILRHKENRKQAQRLAKNWNVPLGFIRKSS